MPALIETDTGTKYVVKWRGTGEGPLANAVDWTCLHLARQAGILVPTPHLITVGTNLISKKQDPDINDLITRSLGLNLCLEYIPDARPYNATLAERGDSAAKDLIYLFDVLFLNIDRTDFNPNMLISKDRLYCIDFAAAMALKMLMNGMNHLESALFPLIRRHPFFKPRSDLTIVGFTFNVPDIVSSMPDEWMSHLSTTRESITSSLKEMLAESRLILERRLALLDLVPLEGIEEIKARTLRNRRMFEEKWGKL